MNTKSAQTLIETLTTFFTTHCKVYQPDPHTHSVPIELPLAGYNDENVVLFVEHNGDHTVLHDGGYLVNYLANHDIVIHSKQKKYHVYSRFLEDLAHRHDFSFSEKDRRFEMQIDPKQGQKALVFAECLIALSFLVMTKAAGLKTYNREELQHLSGLKVTLSTAFPEIKVAQGLLPQVLEKPAPQTWGLTLSVPRDKTRGCVHYLRGPDWAHLLRGAIVLNTFAHMSEKWFNTKPGCYWGVYGGPPELLDDTNKVLKDLGNGHAVRLIPFNEQEQLVHEVSDGLNLPTRQDWRRMVKLQQEVLGENLLKNRIQQVDAPSTSDSRNIKSADLWTKTASEPDLLGEAFSAGFDAAAYRLLTDTEYRNEFMTEPLETYGIAFARYVLAEIKERPGRIKTSRFKQIADAFLQYYRNDGKATDVIDREVAEIEAQMDRLAAPEEVFRQEEHLANRYMVAELKSLRAELAKLVETKNGR